MESPQSELPDDDFVIASCYRLVQNDLGEFVKIPAAPGLYGFLVEDSMTGDHHQVRLLGDQDVEIQASLSGIWQSVEENRPGDLFPRILEVGIDDDVPFYVSTFSDGEPVHRYIRQQTVPPVVAAQLVAELIDKLLTQKLIPPSRFALPFSSLWLENRIQNQISQPTIVLGDLAPRVCANAEEKIIQLCRKTLLELTGYCGDPPFQLLCESIDPQTTRLSELKELLEEYRSSQPAVGNFWQDDKLPRSLMGSLSIPEVTIEQPVSESPQRQKLSDFSSEKLKYFAGGVLALAAVIFGLQVLIIAIKRAQASGKAPKTLTLQAKPTISLTNVREVEPGSTQPQTFVTEVVIISRSQATPDQITRANHIGNKYVRQIRSEKREQQIDYIAVKTIPYEGKDRGFPVMVYDIEKQQVADFDVFQVNFEPVKGSKIRLDSYVTEYVGEGDVGIDA